MGVPLSPNQKRNPLSHIHSGVWTVPSHSKRDTALLLVPPFLAVDWNVWVWMGIFHIRDSARWLLLLLESLHCSQGPRSKPVVFRLSQEWKPVLK